ETNLYKILGVSSKATINEIKKAYRVKALDTHPDKNKDVPKELAAEQFQKVVHAFEVLSDVRSRQHYDRTG
ncbi:J-domain Dnj-12-like protein, partial [Fragilariopsis cylindrus CCMP1102]